MPQINPLSNPTGQVIRYPLIGSYFNRVPVFGSGGSSIAGIAVAGVAVAGSFLSPMKDGRYINCYKEKYENLNTGSRIFFISKRPGTSLHNTPAAGSPGSSIILWSIQGTGEKIISAFGTTNSTLYDGTTSLGNITGKADFLNEFFLGSVATISIASSDGTGWYIPNGAATSFTADAASGNATLTNVSSTANLYIGQQLSGTGVVGGQRIQSLGASTVTMTANASSNSTTATYTSTNIAKIIDVDFPATHTGPLINMDGYNFIMSTDGKIYNSDLNSITSWGAASFISAEMYPDKGIGLSRYKNLLVAFGKETIEFFQNVGNPSNSPLQRLDNAFIRLGAANANSFINMADVIFFISAKSYGGTGIYMLDGLRPVKISPPSIDSYIAAANISDLWLSGFSAFGKTFILCKLFGCFVYCLEDQEWMEWNSSSPGNPWFKCAASPYGNRVIYSISDSTTSGKVFKIDPSDPVWTDDSYPYTMLIQTPRIDMENGNLKRINKVEIIGNKEQEEAILNVQWSDDDYTTASAVRYVDLSDTRPWLTRCGMARRRSFFLSNASDTPVRLEAIELEMDGMLR